MKNIIDYIATDKHHTIHSIEKVARCEFDGDDAKGTCYIMTIYLGGK